jgi:2-keto-4-pentenoate hydratase/2-oxohepta-3-ene-1,7-dioic acid hydratase in catechol pathway
MEGSMMTVSILRTADAWWALTSTGAAEIDTGAQTTRALLDDRSAIEEALVRGGTVPIESLTPVSPVTAPCRIIAQLSNYASHARDVGLDPSRVPLTFFRKASGSISGPHDAIVRPAHVQLLDYEVEIGLVIGRELPVGTPPSDEDLLGSIAGLVVADDVSARDVQLSKGQYYESKSYPTFTPLGPVLVLLDADELKRFSDLRLQLRVNDRLRQNMLAEDMLYEPLQALRGLTAFQRLDPGDLVLTGTPVGTAVSAPPTPVRLLGGLLPERIRWRIFLAQQRSNPKYLQEGDVVEASAGTDDGVIDLGRQRMIVRWSR